MIIALIGSQGWLLFGVAVAFGLMWGLGAMIGPSIAGTAMDLMGPQGLPLSLTIIFCLLGLAAPTTPLS